MDLKGRFTHIFFDADDTLWDNEQYFRDAEARFTELLSDYTTPEGVQDMLWRKQEDNIPLFGYGSKTYLIGMTDAAMELCGGTLPEDIREIKNKLEKNAETMISMEGKLWSENKVKSEFENAIEHHKMECPAWRKYCSTYGSKENND